MNNPINICLAGYGGFGKRLHGYLEKMPQFRVKYIYHPDSAKAAQYGPLGSSDIYLIMNDPDLEAIIVATPHDWHFDLVWRSFIHRRHHIFVEKPMLSSWLEFETLNRLERPNKVFIVGHNQRRETVFRKAKEFLISGEIGKVVDVYFNFSHGGAYILSPDNWRCSAKRNREGPLAVLGSHAIDTIHYLFGDVASVCARLYNVSGKTEAPDASSVMMTMASGVNILLSSNYCVPSEKFCVISGTEGVIYIDRDKIFLRKGRDVSKVSAPKQEITVAPVDTIQEELQEFTNAILNGKKVETGFEEGSAVVKVLDACYRSSVENRPIQLSL